MDGAVIEVDGVVRDFGRDVRALDGISLTVERGTAYALLGPNGAGKTTLIRILATLLRPDAGSARVAGVDVRTDSQRVRTLVGLAGQYAAVDELLTGRENCEMVGQLYGLARGEARRRSAHVLEAIGLTAVADRPVRTYSGGLRRRLDLAASLVGRPRLLLLDEPTSGLDPVGRAELWRLIRQLVAAHTTVLLATQYLDEADHIADRVAVIDRGRVVGEGTNGQLKRQIGDTVLELTVPPADQPRAAVALDGIGGEIIDAGQGRLRLTAPDGARTLTDALRRLDAVGVPPRDVALHAPTLDHVFLTLTGHHTDHAASQPGSTVHETPSAA